jgi:hypothetical protein
MTEPLPDPMGSSLLPLTRPPSWMISLSDVQQGENLARCEGAASPDGANKDRAADRPEPGRWPRLFPSL